MAAMSVKRFAIVVLCIFSLTLFAVGESEFVAEEAHQGVAVDANFVYAIGTKTIGKYDKQTGERLIHWEPSENEPIIHLDSRRCSGGQPLLRPFQFSPSAHDKFCGNI